MDPQVPRHRKSRAQFKRIRNRRNRRMQKEVLNIINKLLDQVTESLSNLPLDFPLPSSPHVSSPISEEWFPSSSRYDLVSSPIFSPISPPSPLYDSSCFITFTPWHFSPISLPFFYISLGIPEQNPSSLFFPLVPRVRRTSFHSHCHPFSSV